MTEAPSIKEAWELKPCPFCASLKVILSHRWDYGFNRRYPYCEGCFARGPSFNGEEEARAWWNTRATLSQPTADRREIVDPHGVLNAAAFSAAHDEETLARRLFLLDEQPNSGAPIRMNCGWKQLKSWNRESYKKQARAILAALDGGR